MKRHHLLLSAWLFLLFSFFGFFSVARAEEEVETIEVMVGEPEERREDAFNQVEMDNDPLAGLWNADPFTRDDFGSPLARMQEHMNQIHTQMDQIFNQRFLPEASAVSIGGGYTYEETPEQIILKCDVPNLAVGSLDVRIEGSQVQIQGTSESHTQDAREGAGGSFKTFSTSRSSFFKLFPLHPDADPDRYEVETGPEGVEILFERKKETSGRIL